MAHTVTRELVDAFYDAYTTKNRDKLATLLHDDAVWMISGPTAVLHFCGTHRGKAEVLDLGSNILPSVFHAVKLCRESLVIDGDRAATLNRMSAQRHDGRGISYRFAHFLRFQEGKLIEGVSIIDTFDAAEQMLGHSLSAQDEFETGRRNLVAL